MESVQSRVLSVTKYYLRVKTLMRLTIKKRELEIQGNPADTTIIVAFHRRKHSYAPTIATEHCRTVRYCISASGAPLSLFCLMVSADIPQHK